MRGPPDVGYDTRHCPQGANRFPNDCSLSFGQVEVVAIVIAPAPEAWMTCGQPPPSVPDNHGPVPARAGRPREPVFGVAGLERRQAAEWAAVIPQAGQLRAALATITPKPRSSAE